MPKSPDNSKAPLGLYCPECKGVRLTVTAIRRPCPGVHVRYRKCIACGFRIKTREVVVRYDQPRVS